MKRAGFTMIELIFVIVILGILSAVALPKFIGVSEQANAGKCKALIGTLNRTVLPAIWSDAVLNNVSSIPTAFSDANITAQITIPTECNTTANYGTLLRGTAGSNTVSMTFGGSVYHVDLNVAASTSEAPLLIFTKQ
jgi:prepilin-type N-terminal cleavage/methylation domain-containing protein